MPDTSTAWVARDGSSGMAIHCTPAHGSSARSGKIQRLAASDTASIVDRPTARWSALFQPAPGSVPQCSPKCWATTTSGRWRRMAAAMSRRRSNPSTTRPSGWPRNSISDTPTIAPLARSSASRTGRAADGGIESIPASPAVTSTYDTSLPAVVQAATAPAMPHSMSSGWATMTVAVRHPSGNGASVIAAR
jgi:hypothetical protein